MVDYPGHYAGKPFPGHPTNSRNCIYEFREVDTIYSSLKPHIIEGLFVRGRTCLAYHMDLMAVPATFALSRGALGPLRYVLKSASRDEKATASGRQCLDRIGASA